MHLIKLTFTLLLTFLLPIFSFASTTITADHTVLVTNYSFTPSNLIIQPGETVAFINVEGIHNINGVTNTLTGQPFNNPVEFFLPEIEGAASGVLMGEITFDQPGIYNYDCSIGLHAQLGMVGTIEVDAFTIKDLFALEDSIPSSYFSQLGFLFYRDSLMDSEGPFTVFLPNDDAVNDVLALMNLGQFGVLGMSDLPVILDYHTASGVWLAGDLQAGMSLPTIYGEDLTISEIGGVLQVDGASIISTNFITDNGVVHVIDKCLAPSDLPQATVWDIIKDSDDHQLLEQAIINNELVEELRMQNDLSASQELPGPFTVFAPTDAAFEAYSQLLGMTSAELIAGQFVDDIVRTHILGTKHESTDFSDGQQIQNYRNDDVLMTINGDSIFANGVFLQVMDLLAYNGVVHVIDEIIAPDLPPLTGTCGTWTLELVQNQNFFNLGWDGLVIDVVVNGEVISNETGLENENISTFKFGVDEEAVVDFVINVPGIFVGPYPTPALEYKIFDENDELIFSSGDDGEIITSVYGLAACGAELSCGFVEIQMFDAANGLTEGWDFAFLSVSINDNFYRSFPLEYGNFQQVFIPTNEGDSIDINYTAGAVPTENSYIVYGPDGALIATQASSGEAPGDVIDLLICEETTSINDPSIELNTSIFPNPTSGELFIKSDIEILRVSITNIYGQTVYDAAYDNVTLDVSSFEIGTYILEVQTVKGSEFHKFYSFNRQFRVLSELEFWKHSKPIFLFIILNRDF